MTNTFYNEHDAATLFPRSHRDKRTPFQVDRDRIIYSAAFRSLQSKTQVFHSGEYDFYRTRLTHSLEVAQIGRGICNHLLHCGGPLRQDFYIDPDLVEACCLAHDIGHPPFGHAGEDALNEVLAGAGGFEGNAQTLRILTHLIFGMDGGMKPTRALLDAVLKYKKVFINPKETPGKFLYADQQEILDFVFDQSGWNISRDKQLEKTRSIECQIMDWADDVAYGLMDIVDGTHAHFITLDSLKRWSGGKTLSPQQASWLRELEEDIITGKLERSFAIRIGECINGSSLVQGKNPAGSGSNRHAFDLAIDATLRERINFYKQVAVDIVFRTPQIKQLEFKGRRILADLFHALRDNYSSEKPLRLMPQATEDLIARSPAQIDRVLADYLSGLTDSAVIRIHRRLFDPAYGSITDL